MIEDFLFLIALITLGILWMLKRKRPIPDVRMNKDNRKNGFAPRDNVHGVGGAFRFNLNLELQRL